MPLNIACFIAVCQPSDILLSPLALPSPTEFPAFQFPTPSSDINCRTGVDERFSLYVLINHIHHIIILLVYNFLAIMNKITKIQKVDAQTYFELCLATRCDETTVEDVHLTKCVHHYMTIQTQFDSFYQCIYQLVTYVSNVMLHKSISHFSNFSSIWLIQ
jgi:hypothetical protein